MARQKIADIKSTVQTLAPEEQAQIKQAVEELKEKTPGPAAERQAQLADIASTIRG